MADVHSEAYILGQNIRKYREQKGWSQKVLSDAVDIDRAEISKIENGERGAISCTALRKFSKVLGVSMDELMEEEKNIDEGIQHLRKFTQLDDNNKSIIDQMTDALLLKQRLATA